MRASENPSVRGGRWTGGRSQRILPGAGPGIRRRLRNGAPREERQRLGTSGLTTTPLGISGLGWPREVKEWHGRPRQGMGRPEPARIPEAGQWRPLLSRHTQRPGQPGCLLSTPSFNHCRSRDPTPRQGPPVQPLVCTPPPPALRPPSSPGDHEGQYKQSLPNGLLSTTLCLRDSCGLT